MTQEELQATFVGRQPLLDSLIAGLEKEVDKPHHQHIILIGPRGIGKTHILSMVYFKVKQDTKFLSQWLPIQFPEEVFGITNLRKFFLRILEEVIKATNDPVLSTTNVTEEDDAEGIYAFLKDYLNTCNKKILLLIDNIDEILSLLSKLEANRLRDILMNDRYFLIYGGAITIFDEIMREDNPFYQFFKIEDVPELKEKDFEELLRRRLNLDERVLDTDISYRLKALYRLTGGNPRLLLILYQLLTSGLNDIISCLNGLLDDLTPYFLQKMNKLSPQQKEIIETIAKSEKPISPTEIAKKTKLEVSVVTSQVSRLLDMRCIVKVKPSYLRNVIYYEIGDRIFGIWFQMRTGGREEQRILFLVTFFQIWYNEKEIRDEIKDKEELLDYLKEALNHIVKREEEIPTRFQMVRSKIDIGQLDEALTMVSEIREDKTITDSGTLFSVSSTLGDILYKKKDYDESIKAYQDAIGIKQGEYIVWYNMGNAYADKGEYDKAIECYGKCFEYALPEVVLEAKEFAKSIIRAVVTFLRLNKYEDADKIIHLCEEKGPKEVLNILYPIKIAVDYLITGNRSLIEHQPIAFRETISDILKETAKPVLESTRQPPPHIHETQNGKIPHSVIYDTRKKGDTFESANPFKD